MNGAGRQSGLTTRASLTSTLVLALTAAGLGTGCVGKLDFDPTAPFEGGGGRPSVVATGSGGAPVTGGWGGGVAVTGGASGSGAANSASGGATATGGASAIGGPSASGGAGGLGGTRATGGASTTGGASGTVGGSGGASGGPGTGGTTSGGATGGAGGGATGPGSGGSVGTASACPTGFDVLDSVFNKKCGGCHGASAPTKNLDLVSSGLAARMVNKASSCRSLPFLSPTLNAKGGAVGYLLDKLAGPVTGCGVQMPPSGPLPATELACVNDWAVAAIAREGTAR